MNLTKTLQIEFETEALNQDGLELTIFGLRVRKFYQPNIIFCIHFAQHPHSHEKREARLHHKMQVVGTQSRLFFDSSCEV
jgi:hypothetical protein